MGFVVGTHAFRPTPLVALNNGSEGWWWRFCKEREFTLDGKAVLPLQAMREYIAAMEFASGSADASQ
jgi:hypothetical protein